MRVNLIYPFVILLLAILPPEALRAQSYSLEESIQYALDNNKNIQNARFEEYIAKAKVKEYLSLGLPQVNASLDLQYFAELPTQILPGLFNPTVDIVTIDGQPYPLTRLDPETFQPIPGEEVEVAFGFPWQSTAGFNLNQLIFDGTYFTGIKAAKALQEVSRKDLHRSQEETAVAVSKAYYQAMIAEENLNLINANLERLKKLFDETKALNTEGFVEKIDVDRLQISYNNLMLEKTNLERLVALSKDMLKFQMGMPVDESIELTEKMSEALESPALADLGAGFDPQLRIEYDILQSQIELQQLNLQRYRNGYLPSLNGFASYQWNAQRSEFNFFDGSAPWFPISVIGVSLNVPIFDGFRKKSQISQTRYQIKQMENYSDIMRNSIKLEIKNAQAQELNSFNKLENLERTRNLAKRVFDVSQIKYKEGVGSSLELNDAETQLKQAESNYLSGVFEYLMAKIELQRSTGEFARYRTAE
ncbi:MAG: TolC family protein [Bacteroidia bacterium]|nr:TolC family protein [Bacteroidia bacterium]